MLFSQAGSFKRRVSTFKVELNPTFPPSLDALSVLHSVLETSRELIFLSRYCMELLSLTYFIFDFFFSLLDLSKAPLLPSSRPSLPLPPNPQNPSNLPTHTTLSLTTPLPCLVSLDAQASSSPAIESSALSRQPLSSPSSLDLPPLLRGLQPRTGRRSSSDSGAWRSKGRGSRPTSWRRL